MLATDMYLAAAFVFTIAIIFVPGNIGDKSAIALAAEILFLFIFGVSYSISLFITRLF